MTIEEKLICDYFYFENFTKHIKTQRFKEEHGLTPKIEEAIEAILETKTKEQFYEELVKRIIKDHRSELNCCPKCNEIARTDKTKQCIFCSHNWQ
ncbi:hypothetical protein Fleli_0648 [Bernardetia litoralis DSM 6794]|uniref:Uncharacterized protein n=1 Tax=Bernardetia litoralis (strain ATCC 23117 / DSM 6794 / NBRC 15988 / NCIMB 1366 / Fx l1 / Sio-4) TaxID=880071 RepID=I4AGM7_BERLS|nr:hypothetical protein [Bernardetia litoralis]AFM03112.1 hypothetical protein Fleli_0648 [Bernardetia litoralis DSM 6794]